MCFLLFTYFCFRMCLSHGVARNIIVYNLPFLNLRRKTLHFTSKPKGRIQKAHYRFDFIGYGYIYYFIKNSNIFTEIINKYLIFLVKEKIILYVNVAHFSRKICKKYLLHLSPSSWDTQSTVVNRKGTVAVLHDGSSRTAI